MVNANGGKSDTQNIHDKERLDERKSEATSKETLSDLAEIEKGLASAPDESSPGPSPDGALDERDEINDAGPM